MRKHTEDKLKCKRKNSAIGLWLAGFLTLSFSVSVAYADIFSPPPPSEYTGQVIAEQAEKMTMLESQLHELERTISEMQHAQAQQVQELKGNGAGTSAQGHAEIASSSKELSLKEQVQIREYLQSQYNHLGRINGAHLVRIGAQTRLMSDNEYSKFEEEQRALAKEALRQALLPDLSNLMLGGASEEGEVDDGKDAHSPSGKRVSEVRDESHKELEEARSRLEQVREQRNQAKNKNQRKSSRGNGYRGINADS